MGATEPVRSSEYCKLIALENNIELRAVHEPPLPFILNSPRSQTAFGNEINGILASVIQTLTWRIKAARVFYQKNL